MAADLCSDACESPNDDPRPQSGRKATLNSRTTPRRSSTAPFDPRELPDLTEMDSIESGAGFVIGMARPSKTEIRLDSCAVLSLRLTLIAGSRPRFRSDSPAHSEIIPPHRIYSRRSYPGSRLFCN